MFTYWLLDKSGYKVGQIVSPFIINSGAITKEGYKLVREKNAENYKSGNGFYIYEIRVDGITVRQIKKHVKMKWPEINATILEFAKSRKIAVNGVTVVRV